VKTITINIVDQDKELDLVQQLAFMIQSRIIDLSVDLALHKYGNDMEEKAMWQRWLAATELLRQQTLTQALAQGQIHIKDILGDDVIQPEIQRKVGPQVVGDYTDPTGFATIHQLIYLNPFNGLLDRLAALREHDVTVDAFRDDVIYNADLLKSVMEETRDELGSVMPTFRSATKIKYPPQNG
jgi:hypothetical protein